MTPTSELIEGLLGWLRGACEGALLSFRVNADPSPTHRPRVTRKGHTYYAESYAKYKADCQRQMAEQLTKELRGAGLLAGRLAVVIDTAVARPKMTKFLMPPGDADNYMRAPMDAATQAGVWGDDGQVVAVASVKRWTEPGEKPGVHMHVGRVP